jgi:hypothetical protein
LCLKTFLSENFGVAKSFPSRKNNWKSANLSKCTDPLMAARFLKIFRVQNPRLWGTLSEITLKPVFFFITFEFWTVKTFFVFHILMWSHYLEMFKFLTCTVLLFASLAHTNDIDCFQCTNEFLANMANFEPFLDACGKKCLYRIDELSSYESVKKHQGKRLYTRHKNLGI